MTRKNGSLCIGRPLAPALLFFGLSLSASAQLVALNGGGTALAWAEGGGVLPKSESPTMRSISDDRHHGDERMPVQELMISGPFRSADVLGVEILDEHGRPQFDKELVFNGKLRAMPVSLTGLRPGRYVARITHNGGVRVLRFTR